MTTLSVPPSGAATARLLRRAQAVARLRHPNLVRMLPLPGGAGLAPVLGNAHRLSDYTLPRGTFKRFDLEQVARLLIDVLSGLSALHEVVTDGVAFEHGAVSPHHIYIDEHGTARLVPLLPAHFSPHAKVERTGYVAPERLRGDASDARSDVFSVGVMLWEALAGKRFCPDGDVDTLLGAGKRPPPIQLAPHVRWAAPLCAIAERAVALDPAERYATAHELGDAIAKAAAGQLSRVDHDAWQEEAPTPVFQPRLHLAQLRASTPPPAVLSVGPAAVEPPASAAPSSLEPSAVESAPESQVRDTLPAEPTRRRGRGLALGMLAMALGVAAIWLPGKLRLLPRLPGSRAAAAGPPAAPLTLRLAEPVASPFPSASAASTAAPASASGSAPASVAAAPTPSVSAKPKLVLPARPAPRKARPRPEDYGF